MFVGDRTTASTSLHGWRGRCGVNIMSKVTAYRARQLYKNISMLFLFPVKGGKLSTGVLQYLMHHVTVSLQQSKITLQNNCINNTLITQPTLSFYF